MDNYNITFNPELSFLSEWDHDNNKIMNDEVLSTTSHEEATKVLEKWQADDDQYEDGLDMMEVDEQIQSSLLGDEIHSKRCVSPCGPLEELEYMNISEDVKEFAPLVDAANDDELCNILLAAADIGPSVAVVASSTQTSTTGSSLSFEEQYQLSLKKLSESIHRSHESRISLMMTTTMTERYSRKTNVTGIISSIEKSSYQLQNYLSTVH